jgi:hypothetical protein
MQTYALFDKRGVLRIQQHIGLVLPLESNALSGHHIRKQYCTQTLSPNTGKPSPTTQPSLTTDTSNNAKPAELRKQRWQYLPRLGSWRWCQFNFQCWRHILDELIWRESILHHSLLLPQGYLEVANCACHHVNVANCACHHRESHSIYRDHSFWALA